MQRLPADLESRIKAQIESGQFVSEEDVIREAMDALEKRQQGLQELQSMVREAEEDIKAGRVAPFDVDATKLAVRERLSQRGIHD